MHERIAVMILAGGYGTRLNSVVADRPKVLADVNGRPFLSYLLDQLGILEVKLITICSGYKGEMIVQAFQYRYKNQELIYSQEYEPLGTAGALKLSLDFCSSEYLMVLNGDSFCDTDLSEFMQWHFVKQSDCTILLTHVANSERFGFVKTDECGRIEEFEEKGIKRSGWINAGVYIIRREIITAIPSNKMVSLEKEVFPHLINKKFYGYKSHGSFIDIGTPESYEKAKEFFSGKQRNNNSPEVKL
ncbi:MAG: nucleotidyltransferase family protein [Smithellaceae bacterium]